MAITDASCSGLAITSGHEPPSQTDIRGNFSVASWNIFSVRNRGLKGSSLVMESLGVNISILQETTLTKGIYARRYGNYSVIGTGVNSLLQEGISLSWRDNNLFKVEEVTKLGPNVITFQLVTEMGGI